MVALQVGIDGEHGGHRVRLSVDTTQIETPPLEHLLFYAGLGTLAAFEMIGWPLALVLMGGHVLLDATNRPGLNQLGEALAEA